MPFGNDYDEYQEGDGIEAVEADLYAIAGEWAVYEFRLALIEDPEYDPMGAEIDQWKAYLRAVRRIDRKFTKDLS